VARRFAKALYLKRVPRVRIPPSPLYLSSFQPDISVTSRLEDELSIRIPDEVWILLYFEDDVWNAHALNFDLVGSGDTPAEAWQQLKDALFAQIAFAVRSVDLDLLTRSKAPEEYFARWKEAKIIPELDLGRNLLKQEHAMFVHLDDKEIQRVVEETSFEREHAEGS
jgi:hypothetical protein